MTAPGLIAGGIFIGLCTVPSSGAVLPRLARWTHAHRERVSLALGTGVVLLGFVILITV